MFISTFDLDRATIFNGIELFGKNIERVINQWTLYLIFFNNQFTGSFTSFNTSYNQTKLYLQLL